MQSLNMVQFFYTSVFTSSTAASTSTCLLYNVVQYHDIYSTDSNYVLNFSNQSNNVFVTPRLNMTIAFSFTFHINTTWTLVTVIRIAFSSNFPFPYIVVTSTSLLYKLHIIIRNFPTNNSKIQQILNTSS